MGVLLLPFPRTLPITLLPIISSFLSYLLIITHIITPTRPPRFTFPPYFPPLPFPPLDPLDQLLDLLLHLDVQRQVTVIELGLKDIET